MCDEIKDGSIIITLSIVSHGNVINTKLSKVENKIFENTRLYSLSGDFSPVIMHDDIREQNGIDALNNRFQRELHSPTMNIMEEYREKQSKHYPIENSCKIFKKITSDKILGVSQKNGWMRCMLDWINNTRAGIYVISVHKKTISNTLDLIYPSPEKIGTNINLLDINQLDEFAKIFNKNKNEISLLSSKFPEVDTTINLTPREKLDIYKEIEKWKITLNDTQDKIIKIRMSYLVDIINKIVGECNINIFDFSCSGDETLKYIPDEHLKSGRIGNTQSRKRKLPTTWGGTKKRKKKINRKRKRKTKKMKRIL
jgi:hypothetical protein